MPQDYLKLLELLADAGCEFIIVGGVAAFLHGGRRVTYDVDVVPKLDAETWPVLVGAIWDAGGRPRIPESRDAIVQLDNARADQDAACVAWGSSLPCRSSRARHPLYGA